MSKSEPPEACGCYQTETPDFVIGNPPGQPAIRFRLATHEGFRRRMLQRLSRWTLPDGEHAGSRPLARLSTRSTGDFTIALLDGWATVLEVLSFYQERIANESFLRTATERRSVLELARAIGYELRPGVAASTWLAFTLEAGENAPEEVRIPAGTPVRSIPRKEGERPQTFETTEELPARPEWNAMRPRRSRPQNLTLNSNMIWLRGADLNLATGDRLLLVQTEGEKVTKVCPRQVRKVQVDRERNVTQVILVPLDLSSEGLTIVTEAALSPRAEKGWPAGHTGIPSIDFDRVYQDAVFRNHLNRAGWSLEDWRVFIDQRANVEPIREYFGGNHEDRNEQKDDSKPQTIEVFVFRERTGIFGNNAPDYMMLSSTLSQEAREQFKGQFVNWDKGGGWPIWKDSHEPGSYYTHADLYLERPVSDLTPDSWLLLEDSSNNKQQLFRIKQIIERSVTGFALSARVTGLQLKTPQGGEINKDNKNDFKVRSTTAWLASEKLELAEEPIKDPVSGITVELAQPVSGLEPGRVVWIEGELAEPPFSRRGEIQILEKVEHCAGVTILTFQGKLDYTYHRDTVTMNANVVAATHGESVEEVLGDGDAGSAFQRFSLRKPPLTYVSAATASGVESTLSIRVNDIEWKQVSAFYGRAPEERCYLVRHDDESNATVQFGDGRRGARLLGGVDNVVARYRTGVGLEGQVGSGSLTQLPRRPLGVEGVTNPVPATGAADPESLNDARRNAPLTVLTLERAVSLRDYEHFARAFAGIGKAMATSLWQGTRQVVCLTVAGSDGQQIDENSMLFKNLAAALEKGRDRRCEVVLTGYKAVPFGLAVRIHLDSAYRREERAAKIRESLLTAFSFDARDFGQPVTAAGIMALIHQVEGVEAVDLDALYRIEENPVTPPPSLLAAEMPRLDERGVHPAELLLIDPLAIQLLEMAP